VSGIDCDEEKARLVRGIIEMGHNLRMKIVIEGIEHPGEAALLRVFSHDLGQGYFFSRPVDASSIDRLLDAQHAVAVA
jgi:EAL domain-containing protein (putative c-di-GMP-specific phosphodiesterase class I)